MALSPGAKVKRWRGATRHPGSSPSWGLHTRDGEAPTVLPNEETGHFPALAASGAGTTPPRPCRNSQPRCDALQGCHRPHFTQEETETQGRTATPEEAGPPALGSEPFPPQPTVLGFTETLC